MNSNQKDFSSKNKTEYEIAINMFRQFATLRRQDMAFMTTVQAGVLTIVKDNLLVLGSAHFLLTAIAFLVLLMGCNNERRLSAYMLGYMKRARKIEEEFGISVLHDGFDTVKRTRFLISNRWTFPLYYLVFSLLWFVIWILNLLR